MVMGEERGVAGGDKVIRKKYSENTDAPLQVTGNLRVSRDCIS